jgi:hypothetical protein
MVLAEESVNIIYRVVDGVSQELKRVETAIERTGKLTEKTTRVYTKQRDMLDRLVNEYREGVITKRQFAYLSELVTENVRKQIKIVSRATEGFKYYYLTLMFAGMQIRRTIEGPIRNWIAQWHELTQGQDEASRGLTRLNVHWTYFKFVVASTLASAIIPLIPHLITIMDWAVTLVQTHPEAVFLSIAGVITAGIFLTAIGQIGMFLQGLAMWKASGAFMALPALIKSIEAAIVGLNPIVAAFLAALGILVIVFTLMDKALQALGLPALWDGVALGLERLKELFSVVVFWISEKLKVAIYGLIGWLKDLSAIWSDIWESINNAFNSFIDSIRPKFEWFLDIVSSIVRKVAQLSRSSVSGLGAGIDLGIPAAQKGGSVTKTGLALVHKGETIIPQGGNSFGNITTNVHIHGGISSELDLKDVTRKISDSIVKDIRRYVNVGNQAGRFV